MLSESRVRSIRFHLYKIQKETKKIYDVSFGKEGEMAGRERMVNS